MIYVIMDTLEKVYLAGFPLLLLFVSAFPYLKGQQSVPAANDIFSGQNCVPTLDFTCPEPQPGAVAATVTSTVTALEFLPLMTTSIYCSIGLVWSFMRLGFIYLNEETTYKGQLSEVKS